MIPKKHKTYFLIIFLLILATALGLTWWFYIRIPPLIGIVSGNGRLEATQIDIATKFQAELQKYYMMKNIYLVLIWERTMYKLMTYQKVIILID